MCLVLTCLYENTITSALIAPSDPKTIQNLIELVRKGYKVIYHKDTAYDINDTSVDKPLFSRPYEILNLSNQFSMDNFVPEFKEFFTSSEQGRLFYGNPRQKRAIFLQSRATVVEDYLGRLEMSMDKYNCYLVKESIGETFDFIAMLTSRVEEYKATISTFKEAGLIRFWEGLDKLHRAYARHLMYKDERLRSEDLITLPNLVPVFSIWAALLGISTSCFVFQLIFHTLLKFKIISEYLNNIYGHI